MTATLFEVERPGTKHADQTNHDQVDGHDEIQQPGHQQNQNAGQQGNQGCEAEVKVHSSFQKPYGAPHTRLRLWGGEHSTG